jgi:DNA-binding XRE family transcriptional regulator
VHGMIVYSVLEDATRRCTECHQVKPLTGFVHIAGTPSAYYGRCRECRNRRARERYRSSPSVRAAEIARSRRNQVRRRSRMPRETELQTQADPRSLVPPKRRPRVRVLLVRLAELRCAAGLTQAELATSAGLARETVIRLERCHRGAQRPTAQALAWVLGVEVGFLKDESSEDQPRS